MHYSIESLFKDRIFVKGYEFLSLAKSIDKNLSNKYSKKILDNAKQSATDVLKTALISPEKRQQIIDMLRLI